MYLFYKIYVLIHSHNNNNITTAEWIAILRITNYLASLYKQLEVCLCIQHTLIYYLPSTWSQKDIL